MLRPPSWLTGKPPGALGEGSDRQAYKSRCDEFIEFMRDEEAAGRHPPQCSETLESGRTSGRMWYNLALESPDMVRQVIKTHLLPMFFSPDEGFTTAGVAERALMRLWDRRSSDFVGKKLDGLGDYEETLRAIFAEAEVASGGGDGDSDTVAEE